MKRTLSLFVLCAAIFACHAGQPADKQRSKLSPALKYLSLFGASAAIGAAEVGSAVVILTKFDSFEAMLTVPGPVSFVGGCLSLKAARKIKKRYEPYSATLSAGEKAAMLLGGATGSLAAFCFVPNMPRSTAIGMAVVRPVQIGLTLLDVSW